MAAGAAAARAFELGVTLSVRLCATPCLRNTSHAYVCARDTQVPATCYGCSSEAPHAQDAEREQQREAGRRRRGRQQQRGWAAATGEGGPTTGGGRSERELS